MGIRRGIFAGIYVKVDAWDRHPGLGSASDKVGPLSLKTLLRQGESTAGKGVLHFVPSADRKNCQPRWTAALRAVYSSTAHLVIFFLTTINGGDLPISYAPITKWSQTHVLISFEVPDWERMSMQEDSC